MLSIDLKFNPYVQLFYHNFSISCCTIRLLIVPITRAMFALVIGIRAVAGSVNNGVIEGRIRGKNVKIEADCLRFNPLNFI